MVLYDKYTINRIGKYTNNKQFIENNSQSYGLHHLKTSSIWNTNKLNFTKDNRENLRYWIRVKTVDENTDQLEFIYKKYKTGGTLLIVQLIQL